MSDATSLPDLGFLIGPEDDYVPPEAPAFDVEDALGADDDGAWPEITVPGGAFGEPSVWEEAPASWCLFLGCSPRGDGPGAGARAWSGRSHAQPHQPTPVSVHR